MNRTGKKARKQSGQNRHKLHFATHTHKSTEKRSRMNWGPAGTLPNRNS